MKPGTSNLNTGPIEGKTSNILKNVLTFSTCLIVKGPPYLPLAKSSLNGIIIIISILGEGTALKWVLEFFLARLIT